MKLANTYLVFSIAEFLEDTAKGTLLEPVFLASKSGHLSRRTCKSKLVSENWKRGRAKN